MQVLIIEDEPLAQVELERLLQKVDSEIEILEFLDSIEESVKWLNSNPSPDLIFLDIQLSDGLSFEIFQKTEVKTPVIFTTAYDEYAIQAFKVNSIDYLLKPVDLEELEKSIKKFSEIKEQFSQNTFSEEKITQLLNFKKTNYKTRFVSRIGDNLKHIPIEEVAYFYAEDKTVFLVNTSGKEFIIDFTLETLEPLLEPSVFFRANRKFILKINSIKNVSRYFNGRLKITLEPKSIDEVLVSREKASIFKNWLDN